MRIRVAGLVEMNGGYALMHRKNVKKTENPNQPYGEYYVFFHISAGPPGQGWI